LAVGGEVLVAGPGNRGPEIRLTLRGENLLGERYQEAFGFDAPGRQLYLGASVALGGGT
jgi:hypothetical protein